MDHTKLTGRLIAAARALSGMRQIDLAKKAGISLPTMKRIEGSKGLARGEPDNIAAVVAILEASGVMFIDANGYGPGVRLRYTSLKISIHAPEWRAPFSEHRD